MLVSKKYVHKIIRDLNKYCFSAGFEKYAQVNGIKELSPKITHSIFATKEKRIEFSTFVNWSYKEAQKIIIKERLKLEKALKSKNLEFEKPYNEHYIFALLRDYADCIAWIMLKHDISAIRNVFLEPKKHSPLEVQNWRSIQKSLDHFNKDPNQFAFATDLTSFFQICDFYCLNTKTGVNQLIEVKTGEVNFKILETFSSKDIEEFKTKAEALLTRSKNPIETSKQVTRTLRQHQRASTALKYRGWGSKVRTNIKTDENITILEEKRDEKSWSVAVRSVIKDMETNGAKYATGLVDYCIFFAYGSKPLTSIDERFFRFRINERYDLGLIAEQAQKLPVFALQHMMGIQTIKPRSLLFSETLGMQRQSKLMAGEEFLLVYLHIPALKHLMKINGFDFETRNMSSYEQKYADPLLRELFGNNKVPVITAKIDGKVMSCAIFGGTWQRIMFDFMSPKELINMTGSIVENSRKAPQGDK